MTDKNKLNMSTIEHIEIKDAVDEMFGVSRAPKKASTRELIEHLKLSGSIIPNTPSQEASQALSTINSLLSSYESHSDLGEDFRRNVSSPVNPYHNDNLPSAFELTDAVERSRDLDNRYEDLKNDYMSLISGIENGVYWIPWYSDVTVDDIKLRFLKIMNKKSRTRQIYRDMQTENQRILKFYRGENGGSTISYFNETLDLLNHESISYTFDKIEYEQFSSILEVA